MEIFRFESIHRDVADDEGFLIEYKTLQLFTSCQENHLNSSGVIFLPSYINPYPELADCIYLISQPNENYINITFISLEIDCQSVPAYYLELRDGQSEESPLMARLCGNGSNVPDFMQTTQNHLRIR